MARLVNRYESDFDPARELDRKRYVAENRRGVPVHDLSEDSDQVELLERLMASLTPRQRECLQMKADQLSFRAMGRLLGIHDSVARNHYRAAVHKILNPGGGVLTSAAQVARGRALLAAHGLADALPGGATERPRERLRAAAVLLHANGIGYAPLGRTLGVSTYMAEKLELEQRQLDLQARVQKHLAKQRGT